MVELRNRYAEDEIIACLMQDIPRTLGVLDELGLAQADFAPNASLCLKGAAELAAQGHLECDCLSICEALGLEATTRHALETYAAECYMRGGTPTMLAKAADAVVKAKKQRIVHGVLSRGVAMLAEGDPDHTVASVVAGLSGIEFSGDGHVQGLEALREERDSYRSGVLAGVPSYFHGRQLGMLMPEKKRGELIVLGGRSSDGKTTLMLQEVYSDGEKGIPCGVIELEMRKHRLIERMACKRTAINPMWFKNQKWSDALAKRFDAAYGEIEAWPIHVSDEANITMDQLEAKAFILKKRHGIRALYIDYLQLITPTPDEVRSGLRAYITQWSRRLKLLARDLDIPVEVLSQLARTEDTRDGELTPGMPTKETLKESGSIEQDADVVELICKKPRQPRSNFTFMQDYWEMEINIDKNREGPTGSLGHIMFPACYHITERGKATDEYLLRYEESKRERGY